MKGAGGVLVAMVAVAALLVCCRADPRQDQDAAVSAVGNDHKSVSASGGGGGGDGSGLVRQVRESTRCGPSFLGSPRVKRQFDEIDWTGLPFGAPLRPSKRLMRPFSPNFIAADEFGLDNFMSKRNFDEIDISAMPMGFPGAYKRASGGGRVSIGADADGRVMFEPYGSSRVKRFDEIDVTGLPFGASAPILPSKRVIRPFSPNFIAEHESPRVKRQFDEIDWTGLPFGAPLRPSKRVMRPFSPNFIAAYDYDRKRNRPDFPMDEIDISAFPIGSKRSNN